MGGKEVSSSSSITNKFDIAIVGGGVLGVTISYWLSELYDCSIVLIEKEGEVAKHASTRNTGLVHRPFYLNPKEKRVFSKAAQKSYFLWKDLASRYDLSWSESGTLEVALNEQQIKTLDQYKQWAIENGMLENEIEVLDPKAVEKLEPEVKCTGAIFSKTDTSVNYGELTRFVFEMAQKNGLKFLGGWKVQKVSNEQSAESLNIQLQSKDKQEEYKDISANFLINAAGGNSVDIAHGLGLAKEYTDLHFRGEYWKVDEPFASKIKRNVYSVAKYKQFPFLDPHFVIRANGAREIGPNATLVFGPEAYKGFSETRFQAISKLLFERPIIPKTKLFTSGTFLSLVWHEWRSSISKTAMCSRVKQFIPSIDVTYLTQRGFAGVRSSVIGKNGSFVPEALFISGERSLHILNYNSPGATGAPAFSAYVISKLARAGHFDGLRKRNNSRPQDSIWRFETVSDL
jgi:L-2-hydroxyglutarate oxidase